MEVSIDGAGEWRPAQLAAPASPYARQEWSFAWSVGARGRHVLRVRAHDATGAVQPDLPRWNRLGYGNNAIQPVVVEVR